MEEVGPVPPAAWFESFPTRWRSCEEAGGTGPTKLGHPPYLVTMGNAMPSDLDPTSMFVLDVLRHDDMEQIDSILKLMNNTGCIGWRFTRDSDFQVDEVAARLRVLLEGGYVASYKESTTKPYKNVPVEASSIDWKMIGRIWFSITPKGTDAWAAWSPPRDSSS
jgi:hypothetical protein